MSDYEVLLEAQPYQRQGSVTLVSAGSYWKLYCNMLDYQERHDELVTFGEKIAAEVMADDNDCPVMSREIPGHPVAEARAEANRRAEEEAARIDAAARWQCKDCDALYKSVEEFMAHECREQKAMPPRPPMLGFEEVKQLVQSLGLKSAQSAVNSKGPAFPEHERFYRVGSVDLCIKHSFRGTREQPSCPECVGANFFAGLGPPSRHVTLTHIDRASDVSPDATAAVSRWRDAGGDDE